MKNKKLMVGALLGAALFSSAAVIRKLHGRSWYRRMRRRVIDALPINVQHKLRERLRGLSSSSETSRCRERLAPFCQGYGLDLGFGGDPITDGAIRMDMPQPYTYVGKLPVQLGGKAEDLYWFRDGVLDFVYSSHLLEDYDDVESVLREWLRVLKPGGALVIFCPDEQVYRKHCAETGQPYNPHHIHKDFSLSFVKSILQRLGGTETVHEIALVDIYSWDLVVRKIG